METLFTFGPEAMQTFTDHYLAHAVVDVAQLPYWDLIAALHPCGRMVEWGLDPDDEARMRDRHGWFVEQAVAHISRTEDSLPESGADGYLAGAVIVKES
jgi:hypothetical protein